MKEYTALFNKMPLFDNIPTDKYVNVFSCLHAKIQLYTKGEIICRMNDPMKRAGILLSGKIDTYLLSKAGAIHSVQQFSEGQIFGEALTCLPEEISPVQIVSIEDSEILFLEFSRLYSKEAKACPYASQVALNLLHEIAQKNVFLNRKVEILAQKKIRDKINIYLQSVSKNQSSIVIPLNRQEMSEFLGVDRSALSRELSLMREEGLIDFNKNEFVIKS
ncbi:Crp/Fnr family transcriptional regulator [Konateibacter massiliensis]|uniref:Crp/Fnr family transcriptional regulator n=1 Tax=Konateibacter massiliensis TaxID=2002841 RepID=UPI000C152343|nr:Crp/Fnr family transcriptional regulator [Konateibacter massiliensis]